MPHRNALRALTAAALAALLAACQPDTGNSATTEPAPAKPQAAGDERDYSVGSSTFFTHDKSRPYDAVGGVHTGMRSLITEIWYPAGDTSESRHPTYGDYVFGDPAVHRRMMTQTTFFHLTPKTVREGVSQAQIDEAIDELFHRQRASYLDAPVAEADAPFPVVVVSHGDAGSRYNMESASEYLASRGYFVIAADHTGNSPYAMSGRDPALDPALDLAEGGNPAFRAAMQGVLPLLDEHGVYGKEETFGQSYTPLGEGFSPEGIGQLDRSLLQRVDDLRAVLGKLEALNSEGRFAGRLDLDRIGLMGRSFGGATTLAGLMLEDRFRSGFAVVPPAMPDLRPGLPAGMLVQPPGESAILAAEGPNALASLHKPTFLLSGAEDKLILGLGTQLAKAANAPAPIPAHPYPLLEQAVAEAEVPAVLAVVDNTNHGSFGVSGPYWWPELKPDTFPRFFDPESDYTLLDAQSAHRVQREMALAFFDLTLKGADSALDTLRSNPWAAQGASLTLRGFSEAD